MLGGYWANKLNHSPIDVTSIINQYQGKNDKEKLKLFKAEFARALKKPNDMKWIGKIYTNGLMNHIGYTELEPSFVAYVELHQYLCQLSDKFHREKHFTSVYVGTAHFIRDFDAAFNFFLTGVKKLESIDDTEKYEIQIHALYKDFLIKLIHDHNVYLKERLYGNLKRLGKTGFQKLDMLDRAVFALQKGWASYEWNEEKYQFETIYAQPADDSQILLLGYNEHDFCCDRFLHVYTWDMKNENSKPIQITYKI